MPERSKESELGVIAVVCILIAANFEKILPLLEKLLLYIIYLSATLVSVWLLFLTVRRFVGFLSRKWKELWAWVEKVNSSLAALEDSAKKTSTDFTAMRNWRQHANANFQELNANLKKLQDYVATLKAENRLSYSSDKKNQAEDPTAAAVESISE
ncbi:MAG: hypothetical protein AB7K68_16585 [Bacteriovoracia bacterium]